MKLVILVGLLSLALLAPAATAEPQGPARDVCDPLAQACSGPLECVEIDTGTIPPRITTTCE